MAKLTVPNAITGKEPIELTGRKFSHYIGNFRYWFFLHESLSVHGLDVTHYDSGKRVLTVSMNARMQAVGDDKAAAKADIDRLVARVGADKVRAVIDAAPKLV